MADGLRESPTDFQGRGKWSLDIAATKGEGRNFLLALLNCKKERRLRLEKSPRKKQFLLCGQGEDKKEEGAPDLEKRGEKRGGTELGMNRRRILTLRRGEVRGDNYCR